jgi:hypothetical protein
MLFISDVIETVRGVILLSVLGGVTIAVKAIVTAALSLF